MQQAPWVIGAPTIQLDGGGHLEFVLAKQSRKIVKHHAALPFGAMANFMSRLRQQEGVAAQALVFTILTAARSSETIGMTWREVDRDARLWTVSPARMKIGTEHIVPLSDAARELLDARRLGDVGKDDYVFAGPKGGPLSNMSMLMLLRRMQYEAITVHGFRSAGELTEFERETIEMALDRRTPILEYADQRSAGDLSATRFSITNASPNPASAARITIRTLSKATCGAPLITRAKCLRATSP